MTSRFGSIIAEFDLHPKTDNEVSVWLVGHSHHHVTATHATHHAIRLRRSDRYEVDGHLNMYDANAISATITRRRFGRVYIQTSFRTSCCEVSLLIHSITTNINLPLISENLSQTADASTTSSPEAPGKPPGSLPSPHFSAK